MHIFLPLATKGDVTDKRTNPIRAALPKEAKAIIGVNMAL